MFSLGGGGGANGTVVVCVPCRGGGLTGQWLCACHVGGGANGTVVVCVPCRGANGTVVVCVPLRTKS